MHYHFYIKRNIDAVAMYNHGQGDGSVSVLRKEKVEKRMGCCLWKLSSMILFQESKIAALHMKIPLVSL